MPTTLDYAPRLTTLRRRWVQWLLIGLAIAVAVAAWFLGPRASPAPWVAPKLPLRGHVYDGNWTMFRPEPYRLDPAWLKTGSTGRWPPILLPQGVVNVALGRPCTTMSDPTIGSAAVLTNGKFEDTDPELELDEGLQWVQIDLQARPAIYAIIIWRPYEVYPYRDVIVQISDDPRFQKGIIMLFNNDHDNSAKLGVGKDWEYVEEDEIGKLILVNGNRARYVRAYSGGSYRHGFTRYSEIEVLGLP